MGGRGVRGRYSWPAMVYLLAAALWHKASPKRITFGAVSVDLAVEVSQLYDADWINSVRGTRLGGLVLGHVFFWSDLGCYAARVALAVGIDRGCRKDRRRTAQICVLARPSPLLPRSATGLPDKDFRGTIRRFYYPQQRLRYLLSITYRHINQP
jgi:hypothetical protein